MLYVNVSNIDMQLLNKIYYITLLKCWGFFMLDSVGMTTPAPSKANAAMPNISASVLSRVILGSDL